jgi:hypothetical protein
MHDAKCKIQTFAFSMTAGVFHQRLPGAGDE